MFPVRNLLFGISCLLFSNPAPAQEIAADYFLRQINSELLLGRARLAVESLEDQDYRIRRYLEGANRQDLAGARLSFANLVYNWKAVEALYIAGVLDEDLIDHPRFIDHFHQGNESIEDNLHRILKSNDNLQKAMFKSSSKGINALEFLLFADIIDSERRWQAALVALDHIRGQLQEIVEFYRQNEGFTSEGLPSVEMIVNALVDSSYRLANWRIGEAAGLADKYRDLPSPQRLEYFRSGLSLHAIQAILETHARVFSIGAESGYFSAAGRTQGLEEIRFVTGRIEDALRAARTVASDGGIDVTSAAFTELFQRSEALHKAYYFLLVDAMNLQGKIVDADGD